MGKWSLCVVVACLSTGCLDFAAAEKAFCGNHDCAVSPDGGAPDAGPGNDAGTPDGGVALDTTLTSGPGPATGPNPQFAFTSNDSTATFECQLGPTETAFTPCTSPKTYSALPIIPSPGYLFQVRARTATQVDTTPAQQQFIVYNVPTIVITAPTNNSVVGTSVNLTYDPESGVVYTCQLDSAAPISSCPSGQAFTGLTSAANPHTLKLTGTDTNSHSASQSVSFNVEDAGPSVTVSGTPSSGATTNSELVSLTFTAHSTLAAGPYTWTCALDGADKSSSCSAGTLALSDIGGGAHTVTVHATDHFGNVGSVLSYSWTVVALSTTIHNIRTLPVPAQTLVTIGSTALQVTERANNRFWVEEGTSPYQGITVQPTTGNPLNDTNLTEGREVTVTGTVAQVNSNTTLTNATYTIGALGSPYNTLNYSMTNGDATALFVEAYEGMYVYVAGDEESCSGFDFCVQTCVGTIGTIGAKFGLTSGGISSGVDTDFSGVVEGTGPSTYWFWVTEADADRDACL